MLDSSGDEIDSRTASVGRQRGHTKFFITDEAPGQKQGNAELRIGGKDVRDLVPDAESSSSSQPSDHSCSENESATTRPRPFQTEKSKDIARTAINWNQGSYRTIRTSLRDRVPKSGGNTPKSDVEPNTEKPYYYSDTDTSEPGGDTGASPGASLRNATGSYHADGGQTIGGGPVQSSSKQCFVDESDDSESGDLSEGGDSILLNLNSRNEMPGLQGSRDSQLHDAQLFQEDTRPDLLYELMNGFQSEQAAAAISDTNADGKRTEQSKEDAIRIFAQKYTTPPTTLADLDEKDLKIQSQLFSYNRDVGKKIDLKQPISCTECLKQGHLGAVCPSKECEHCGAWNLHESRFCPSWRRCQKCRERGHDGSQCTSALKGSAMEIPCDLCGSEDHIEMECDVMWKVPKYNSSPGPILISISCCRCTSNRHLVGDCPSLRRPIRSSSWTLKSYNPDLITNINAVIGHRGASPSLNGARSSGQKFRGRQDYRSPSPDSDDAFAVPGRRNQVNKNRGRPNIRFGGGIGRNRNLSGHHDSRDSRQPYRDRQDFPDSRQRSLSPNPYAARNRDTRRKPSWQPPRSPPRDHPKRGPPPRRGRDNKADSINQGFGRGGPTKRGSPRDSYRPLNSPDKKPRDKRRN